MAAIQRLRPVARQNMILPELVGASQWVDNLVLATTTSQSYTVPTDGAGNRATVLRIKISVGPVYLNTFGGTATVPGANNTGGTGEVVLSNTEHYWTEITPGAVISFIASAASVVSIEVWS